MATIASNAIFPGTSPAAATQANNAAGLAKDAAADAKDSSATFMQLVEGMIQGNTPGEQLPANLVDFLLTGDADALQGLELDTEADTDDDDTDDDALSALTALLPGLQSFQPIPAADTAVGGDTDGVSVDLSIRQNAMQSMLETTQATLATALDEMAADAGLTDGAVDTAAAPQQPSGSAQVQNLMAAHRAAEAAPAAASAEVRTPVGAPGWSDEIGSHLTMMAANGRETASLRLSPEHLGPLEIRIAMKDGEASVTFNASNPDTRSALEQSLPRLREMFASQGVMLGDANVSREAPRDSFKAATFADASRGSSDAGADGDVKPVTVSRLGLVDTYV